MAKLFGRGCWQPLQRRVVWQALKRRPIDDGKRARTIALTTLRDALVCTPPEIATLPVNEMACAIMKKLRALPRWPQPVMSAEDWRKGDRQASLTKEHMSLATIAAMRLRCPKGPYHKVGYFR